MTSPPERGDAASVLREGLAGLGLELSVEQQAQLMHYLALIEQWNRVYNLTALREPKQILTQHLLDSLATAPPLQRQIAASGWLPDAVSLLDVGSGAGLPGVALAIACPGLVVTCVDAVGKKASFVRQVSVELGLTNLSSIHGRVEALLPRPWQLITSRAFASLGSFIRLTEALLAPDGVWMAMKGKAPTEEVANVPAEAAEVFHVEPLHVPRLNAQRCIVWMRKKRRE